MKYQKAKRGLHGLYFNIAWYRAFTQYRRLKGFTASPLNFKAQGFLSYAKAKKGLQGLIAGYRALRKLYIRKRAILHGILINSSDLRRTKGLLNVDCFDVRLSTSRHIVYSARGNMRVKSFKLSCCVSVSRITEIKTENKKETKVINCLELVYQM